MKRIIIIGGGIGGLTASIYLKKNGFDVTILEAGERLGGLAKSEIFDGSLFDAGPYILLDQPGLVWSFNQLGLSFTEEVPLHLIEHIYSVNKKIYFDKDLDTTVDHFNNLWKGEGDKYRKFVVKTRHIYEQLHPYTFISHPTPWHLIRNFHWKLLLFMGSSLQRVLHQFGLNEELKNAIGIWTHVASQSFGAAPGPMAFVPSLFHSTGSYYPTGGIGSIGTVLEKKAADLGVRMIKNMPVTKILVKNGRAEGVLLGNGEMEPASAVISNMSAVSTYQHLLEGVPQRYRNYLQRLPLQSPGISAYLKIKTQPGITKPYLQFKMDEYIPRTIAFVNPGFLGFLPHDEYHPARLIAPLPHGMAEGMSNTQELEMIDDLIHASWWKENVLDYQVVHRRTTKDWGKDFYLYRNSMNPTMTAAFMRKGRIPHKSPYVNGLYFCGSSTHPGQWISFCSISGILAAQKLMENET